MSEETNTAGEIGSLRWRLAQLEAKFAIALECSEELGRLRYPKPLTDEEREIIQKSLGISAPGVPKEREIAIELCVAGEECSLGEAKYIVEGHAGHPGLTTRYWRMACRMRQMMMDARL